MSMNIPEILSFFIKKTHKQPQQKSKKNKTYKLWLVYKLHVVIEI